MVKNSKEIILTLLNAWRNISIEEAKALRFGDLDRFEKLNSDSTQIQSQLDNILSDIDLSGFSQEISGLMEKIRKLNSDVLKELQTGTKELSKRIALLRKNKVSMKGYKQNKSIAPRFMNKHT
jgi:uncharacterized protein (UPF0335 family)